RWRRGGGRGGGRTRGRDRFGAARAALKERPAHIHRAFQGRARAAVHPEVDLVVEVHRVCPAGGEHRVRPGGATVGGARHGDQLRVGDHPAHAGEGTVVRSPVQGEGDRGIAVRGKTGDPELASQLGEAGQGVNVAAVEAGRIVTAGRSRELAPAGAAIVADVDAGKANVGDEGAA